MQERPNGYTQYARSLCPSWCTEDHAEPTDNNDLSAVLHHGPVDTVTVLDYYGHPSEVDVRLGQWDSLSGDAEDGRPIVHLQVAGDEELSPAGAVQVAQALIRAAEAARRG